MDGGHRRLPQRWRHLHWLHDAGLSRQVHAVHGRAVLSSHMIRPYGAVIRRLRRLTNSTLNQEPKWRHNGPALTTGYQSN
jgi:hypothetical protein